MVRSDARRFAAFVAVLYFATACSAPASRKGSLPSPKSPTPIILDSDGAVFWDDGAALAMLLQHPDKVRIEGICLVIGNHWPLQGAEYLARILKAAGQPHIPLYIGADEPLVNNKKRMLSLEKTLIRQGAVGPSGFWKGAYGRPAEVRSANDVKPAKGEALSGIEPQSQDAVTFIVDTLMHAPEPITYVAIGPLTDLAKAIQKEPRIVRKIGQLLFMGGNIRVKGNTTPSAEFNVLFDPEAAQIVLSSAIQEKLLFPLDLSNQARITRDRYQELVSVDTPITALLKADRGPKFADPAYSEQAWDTTVAAYLSDPSYVTGFEDLAIRVVTQFGPRYGAIEPGPAGQLANVRVLTRMDSAQFFLILKRDLTARVRSEL